MKDAPEIDDDGFLVKESQSQAEPSPLDAKDSEAEVHTPPKRRRGRPSKNPALIAEGISSEEKKSRAAKPKRQKHVYSADAIALMGKQIVGIHSMAAIATGLGELQISDAEGQALAQSVVNVADQYGLEIDGKTGAALQLFATCAMIYGPRYLAVRGRAQQARSQPARNMGSTEPVNNNDADQAPIH